MKKRLKIIIPASAAVIVILTVLFIIFNIPYNLNEALRFYDSEQIALSFSITGNAGGQAFGDGESFIYYKGTIEFDSINYLLNNYSYNITAANNINATSNKGIKTIIIADGNSVILLVNTTGANVEINGKTYRMNHDKIEELIDMILAICRIE